MTQHVEVSLVTNDGPGTASKILSHIMLDERNKHLEVYKEF